MRGEGARIALPGECRGRVPEYKTARIDEGDPLSIAAVRKINYLTAAIDINVFGCLSWHLVDRVSHIFKPSAAKKVRLYAPIIII